MLFIHLAEQHEWENSKIGTGTVPKTDQSGKKHLG
jgi:hypothetical protein